MTITAEDLVRREVHYCVSYLVSTLAGAAYTGESSAEGTDLQSLAEQAWELARSEHDWEQAQIDAKEAGYLIVPSPEHPGTFEWVLTENGEETDREGFFDTMQEALEAICAGADFETAYREVYEHWIVSDWLADKLAEKGEKVDKDFAGMTVWARTTAGQGIASDSVIEAIAADAARSVEG